MTEEEYYTLKEGDIVIYSTNSWGGQTILKEIIHKVTLFETKRLMFPTKISPLWIMADCVPGQGGNDDCRRRSAHIGLWRLATKEEKDIGSTMDFTIND